MAQVAVMSVGMLLTGCAARSKDQLPILAWPPPPDPPRIKFVRALGSQLDLKGKTTLQSVLDFIIGKPRAVWHLNQPIGLAISDDGERLYVSDYAQRRIYVFDFEHKTVTFIGGEGEPLSQPVGLALDAAENLYVVDQDTNKIVIFDAAHKFVRDFSLGNIVRANGVALDRDRGRLYVVDTSTKSAGTFGVKVFDLNGTFLRDIGEDSGSPDGHMLYPTYITLGAAGNLYVADTMNSRVCEFDPDGKYVRFFGGMGDRWGEMNKPKGVALDSFGNLYVVDSAWGVVQIFNMNRQVLLFFGGRSRVPGMFENPTAITIDKHNRIYVADTFNFRVDVYDLVNTTAADSVTSASAPPVGSRAGPGDRVDAVGQ